MSTRCPPASSLPIMRSSSSSLPEELSMCFSASLGSGLPAVGVRFFKVEGLSGTGGMWSLGLG